MAHLWFLLRDVGRCSCGPAICTGTMNEVDVTDAGAILRCADGENVNVMCMLLLLFPSHE